MGDIGDSRCAIAFEKDAHAFELLPHGVSAAGPDLPKTDRIGQLGRGGEERLVRRRL
jgi:hypothetical protein